MSDTVETLGEALRPSQKITALGLRQRAAVWLLHLLSILLITTLTTIPIWWLVSEPKTSAVIVVAGSVCTLWGVLAVQRHKVLTLRPNALHHPLIANDQHGFMKDLKLREKTAIFDGSNIYHFGLTENLGPRALGLISKQLRTEGYRIVCFFDANIHYTLIEHGDAPRGKSHSIETLKRCFGLGPDEIYVVPAGTQADKYILESLKHLPYSFAITNDYFRDYAKTYGSVMTGDQWRKGVVVAKNEIRIIKHRFAAPVYLS